MGGSSLGRQAELDGEPHPSGDDPTLWTGVTEPPYEAYPGRRGSVRPLPPVEALHKESQPLEQESRLRGEPG